MSKIEDIRRHHGDRAAEKAPARAAASAPRIGDRYGRALQIGDRVHYEPDIAILCEVLDISPNLDPRPPAGTVVMVLGVSLPIQTTQNKLLARITRVWSVQEIAADMAAAGLNPDGTPLEKQDGDGSAVGSPAVEPPGPPDPAYNKIVLTDPEKQDDPPPPAEPPAGDVTDVPKA